MSTVVGKDHLQRPVSTLDLDNAQRLALVQKVINIRLEGKGPGRGSRDWFEAKKNELKSTMSPDEAAYVDKIFIDDIPVDQETHPDGFTQRQRGGFPTTLRGLEALHKRAIELQKKEGDK